jgi:uncharacterized protein with PQ loop repeat
MFATGAPAIQTYTTKQVDDLSFFTLVLLVISATLWTLHGFFIKDISLLIAGFISLAINISMVVLYWIYSKVDLLEMVAK